MLFLTIVIALAAFSLFIGLLVLMRNHKNTANVRFFAICIFAAIWGLSFGVTNILFEGDATLDGAGTLDIFNRISFLLGLSLMFSVVVFSYYFPRERKKVVLKAITPIFAIVALLSLTSYVSGITTISGEQYAISTGSLSWAYVLVMLMGTALIVYNFATERKELNPVQKTQLKLLAFGFGASLTVGLFLAVISEMINPEWSLDWFSPGALILFLLPVGAAVARYKMFDFRAVLARALVYALSIVSIGFIYATLVFGISGLFIDVGNISYSQRTLYAFLALLIAVTYQPIVRFFNRYTSKLFFRDAYDTQVVLDQIGKIIVGSIDLHKIEKSALRVLADALRPTYTGFVLKSTTGGIDTQDFVGEAPHFKSEELAKTLSMISKHEVVYDELEQSNELAQLMRVNDISFITPLITKNETIGYLLSGPKKSGNIYSQQDKSMVTIASNELAVALQNAQRFDEIQAFNITLQEKVDEATKELKRTNRKLVELDEAKDEFISMASHQLRTPLTSIKGYISMLVEGDLGKLTKQQQSALKEAFISSQRMVFLISDFLNVSRIRTGKFVIEPKEVDLAKMVSEEMVQLREMAESKKLEVAYQQPSGFPIVKLDDNKMRQVIMNMIDNAIYYTPSDGTIEVQLYVDGKDVVFKVIDTGIGVPKAEQHKLFAKFFRAANARKARPDGTGLGLFMAQKVVVAQNGSMIFESEEGKGSTFGFRFPLSEIKI